MQVTKIIAGGQTGADQAALDAAIALGIPHGGWISGSRLSEDGPLAAKSNLTEAPADSSPGQTARNVLDSDGTVIFSHGPLTGGSKRTADLSKQHEKPCLHVDLCQTPPLQASVVMRRWVAAQGVRVLNVAGARACEDPGIYHRTYRALWGLLSLASMTEGEAAADVKVCELKVPPQKKLIWPETLDELVEFLGACLPFGRRVSISRMNEKQLVAIHQSLGAWIQETFGLWQGNDKLLKSAESWTFRQTTSPEDASWVVVRALASKLRRDHWLKMI